MLVSQAFAESNRSQTERIRRLVAELDDARLKVKLPNGWTVAGALAHLAFWDRQRLNLMRRFSRLRGKLRRRQLDLTFAVLLYVSFLHNFFSPVRK